MFQSVEFLPVVLLFCMCKYIQDLFAYEPDLHIKLLFSGRGLSLAVVRGHRCYSLQQLMFSLKTTRFEWKSAEQDHYQKLYNSEHIVASGLHNHEVHFQIDLAADCGIPDNQSVHINNLKTFTLLI